MSDCNQMTLISCETNPLAAVVGGLCREQGLASAAWSIVRGGGLAELSEPELIAHEPRVDRDRVAS